MTSKNIITYGCKLNIYESKVIQQHMDQSGLKNYLKVKITRNQKVEEGRIIPINIKGYSPSYLKATI